MSVLTVQDGLIRRNTSLMICYISLNTHFFSLYIMGCQKTACDWSPSCSCSRSKN